jgi:hypothetical protein
LRLGLVPGAYSRADIEALVEKPPTEIVQVLRHAFGKDALGLFIDRLDDIYISLPRIDHVAFWTAVAELPPRERCDTARRRGVSPENLVAFAISVFTVGSLVPLCL